MSSKVKALQPAFLRWPGGNVAQDYHWRWGIGPRDERPRWINLSWKNELEPSDFGTDEFIRFAGNVGAEPSITVNVEGRGATAEEAAAWVEYCNGPPTSTLRRDARAQRASRALRRQVLGDRQRDLGRLGARPLRRRDLRAQLHPLRRRDAGGRSVDPAHRGAATTTWPGTAPCSALAGERIDYLAIHHYYGQRDMAGDAAQPDGPPAPLRAVLRRGRRRCCASSRPTRPSKLAINEWGLDLPESQQYSMLGALYGARLMNVFERTATSSR